MIKLSQKDMANAKSWLFDVFVEGGVFTTNKANQRSPWDRFIYNTHGSGVSRTAASQYCTAISEEVINRQFKDLDTAFTELSKIKFLGQLGNTRGLISRSPEYLAAYVASFCKTNGLFWDPSIITPYELAAFEKTYLGAALRDYGCYTTSEDQPQAQPKTKTTATGATVQAPKSGYKTSGAQSANVRDLRGTPGNKEILSGISVMYKIEGVNTNSPKTPSAFIRPLKPSGVVGTTNKVFVGDPSGYTDCIVFFDNNIDADKFLMDCYAAGIVPSNIQNPRVVKAKVDPNGYYKVGTQFGEAYIKASKLNEALECFNDTEKASKTSEARAAQEAKPDWQVDYIAFAENLLSE